MNHKQNGVLLPRQIPLLSEFGHLGLNALDRQNPQQDILRLNP